MVAVAPSPTARIGRRCRTCRNSMKGHPRGYCPEPSKLQGEITHEDELTDEQAQMEYAAALSPLNATPPRGPVSVPTNSNGMSGANPNARPVMPGTYDHNDRPSEVSQPPCLIDRIGPKLEDTEADAVASAALRGPLDSECMNDYDYSRGEHSRSFEQDRSYDYSNCTLGSTDETLRARRRISAPLQHVPTLVADSSGTILPEHSVSQRNIQMQQPGLLTEQLHGGGTAAYPTPEVERYDIRIPNDLQGAYHYGYERDDTHQRVFPSDNAAIGLPDRHGRGFGHARMHAQHRRTSPPPPPERGVSPATSFSSGLSASFSALLHATGAQPLMSVYAVGSKYVPFMRRRARAAGLHAGVLPGSSPASAAIAVSPAPATEENVFLVLGRDRDAVRHLTKHVPPEPSHSHSHTQRDRGRGEREHDACRHGAGVASGVEIQGHAHAQALLEAAALERARLEWQKVQAVQGQSSSSGIGWCLMFTLVVFAAMFGGVLVILGLARL